MVMMIVAFTVVLGVLTWVTLRGVEAWPFSAYPMFSVRTTIHKVRVVRIALETETGERVWWRSAFYRYPEAIGLSLKKLYTSATSSTALSTLAQQQKVYAEVIRLLRQEEGNRHRYRALLVIRRTVGQAGEEATRACSLMIQEEVLARVPLSHDHS